MKVSEVLIHLAKYQPDDEIVVAWFDLAYVTEPIDPALLQDKEIVEQAWQEIIPQAEDFIENHLAFTQTGADITALLENNLKQKEQN